MTGLDVAEARLAVERAQSQRAAAERELAATRTHSEHTILRLTELLERPTLHAI